MDRITVQPRACAKGEYLSNGGTHLRLMDSLLFEKPIVTVGGCCLLLVSLVWHFELFYGHISPFVCNGIMHP
ncbi:hypothetical protein Tco_0906437 [Tanacetum coccineum]|uniref:Uncharacterized protein n=1 Tax=Tanacetum coccineum TaxID=301880 RepID=A0ABQ5CJ68_9ASTR